MTREASQKNRSSLWAWGTVLLVILIIGIIRVRMLSLPLERDEGEYAYTGQLLLQGVPAFKLAYTMKLPGTTVAYALIMACFGQTPAGIHFGFLLANAMAIVLVFLLARKLLGTGGGLIACANYAVMSVSCAVLGLSAHATHFVVLFALAGILFFLRAAESKRLVHFFLSGMLFGMAFLMKQPGLFFSIFGAFLIVWFEIKLLEVPHGIKPPPFNWGRCARRLLTFSLGIVLPFGLTCLLLWRAGVFEKFWFWTFTCSSSYGHEVSGAEGFNRLTYYFGNDCGPDVLLWVLSSVGLALMLFDQKPGDRKPILLVLLFVSLISVCPGLYFRQHYFVLALPAISLLIGYGASFLHRVIAQAGFGPIARAMPSAVFAAVCLLVIVDQHKIYFRDSPTQAGQEIFGPESPFVESLDIAKFIRDHTATHDCIAVIGSEPQIYFYAKRRSATGYIYTFNLMEPHLPMLRMQKDMIQEIEAAQPAILVDVRLRFSWNKTEESEQMIFDWRDKYAKQFYDIAGVINFFRDRPSESHWGDDSGKYLTNDGESVVVLKRKTSTQAGEIPPAVIKFASSDRKNE